MSFVTEIVVTTVVAKFCQQLERRLAADDAFVQCLCCRNWKTFINTLNKQQDELNKHTEEVLKWMDARRKLDEFTLVYKKTKGKDLSRFIESYTNRLNLETEWIMTWWDIWFKYVNEKNGFNKMVRECEKINKARAKARAKAEAKRVREQTRAETKLAKANAQASLPKESRGLGTPAVKPKIIPPLSKAIPELPKTTPKQPKTVQETPEVPEAAGEASPAPKMPQTRVCEPTKPQQEQQTSNHLAKYRKFAVKKNGKEPACTWSDQSNWTKKEFNPNSRNTGIPTGPVNNLLVVDLDVKDDGVEEFQNYIAEHGNIDTFIVQTPSGGYHYYFNYASANKDDEMLIKSFLNNASKYRGRGVDIRSVGGYIVSPPSRRDGKNYKVINNTAPIDIPSSLISWLIVGRPPVVKEKRGQKEVVREISPNTYHYDLTDEQIKTILAKLPEKYLDNYSDWLVATTVLKCHGKHQLWDEWCKQSPRYNQQKNADQWNYNKGFIDINYLIWALNKNGAKLEYVSRFKPYTPITRDISNIKQVSFNKGFVSEGLSYDTFEKHETIIIKSCTGTGKTTAVAKHAKQYMTPETKFLSITTRTSLSDQHEASFEQLGMKNYQDVRANLQDAESLTVCLNSLAKLDDLEDEELANYIVYVDEVSSFLEFTHNDTLDSVLKRVFVLLTRFARCAGKLIVSDALISDNTFEFLKHRDATKTVMLTNMFQKFLDVPAVRVRSEPAFLEKLVEHCNTDKPFLFGCDSCDVVTKFYHRCIDRLTDQNLKDKFLLITADTATRIKNASTEFKDKFVFFSPKITFGVDFSVEVPQDMFIYVKGNSIQPSGVFQQATRTRNIQNLYYYGECGNDASHYDTLEEAKQNIETCASVCKSLASPKGVLGTACTYIDENDELKFVHNTFFNLYCYNEFVKDVYASNKMKHFELILEQNGFDITVEGEPQTLSKQEKQVQRDIVEEIAEELFEDFLTTTDITLPKFEALLKNIGYLHLDPTDRETLQKFKKTVMSKYQVQEHDATIRLLKCTEHIDDHLAALTAQSMDAKLLTNGYHQAKLIKEFESRYGLSLFTVSEAAGNTEVDVEDSFWKLIKHVFRVTRAKPTTANEVKQLYVSIVKSATCKDLIKSKQLKTKKDRGQTAYTLNEGHLKYHIELNGFKNKSCRGFAQEVVDKFGLTPEVHTQAATDYFLDALDV